uniref:Uncharacterized protein n=1 Tax=Leersia perrieri TaxID=77586 RepID=A0A0D9X848_9ORYZ
MALSRRWRARHGVAMTACTHVGVVASRHWRPCHHTSDLAGAAAGAGGAAVASGAPPVVV